MRRNYTNRLFLFTLFTLLFYALMQAGGPNKIPFVKDGEFIQRYLQGKESDRWGVYVYNRAKNSFVRFAPEYKGVGAQISPKGTYISFWGTDKKDVVMFHGSKGWSEELKLQLFSVNGKRIKSFDLPVGGTVWFPNEEKILYVEVPYAEMANPENKTFWILDIKSGDRIKIPDKGSDFTFAKFDNNIYYFSSEKHKVVRYNVRKKKLEETEYNGVDFSNNGEYYFYQSPESDDIKIYETKTNTDITATILSAIKHDLSDMKVNWTAVRWDEINNLVFADLDLKKYFVFDMKRTAVTRKFDGFYIGIVDTLTKEAAIIEHGKIITKGIE
ncbi:MAG: hypothetical protein HYR76_09745 [Ignavibacteria bacterium]|nr:hypothetical protein [Ignavibacteria bacterium]